MRDDRALVALGDLVDINPREEPLREDAPFIPMDAVSDGCSGVIRYVEERGSRGGPRFRSGDTLFARITPCLENGKVALVPESIERGSGSTEFLVLRPKAGILPQFVFVLSTWGSLRREAARLMTGTSGRQRLSGADLGKLLVPALSLEEQRRIVDLISSIDHAIQAGERYEVRVEEARSHLLQQLLEPSDDWAATTLGDAADIQMGQSPPGSTYNEVGDGLPFLQGSAEFGFRHPTPVKWCSAPKKKAQVGDLLVSVRAPVGDLNFADQDLAVGRGLAVVRGRSGTSTTGFLALAIERNLQELEMRSGGGMFKSITKQGLQGLPIFLPSLLEQQRIVGVTSSLEVVLSRTRSYVAALKGLRTQALESLLSGQHEIPDSYDRFLEEAS